MSRLPRMGWAVNMLMYRYANLIFWMKDLLWFFLLDFVARRTIGFARYLSVVLVMLMATSELPYHGTGAIHNAV